MSAAERDSAILKSRAGELAREVKPEASADGYIEIVEFELSGESHAFELKSVREISRLKNLTPVPCTPAFILGIINLRGELQTVIDLGKFFDLPPRGITELNQVILIQHGDIQLGVLADAIVGTHRIPLANIQPPLPTHTGVRADYLRGITAGGVAILDAAAILSDPSLLINDQVNS